MHIFSYVQRYIPVPAAICSSCCRQRPAPEDKDDIFTHAATSNKGGQAQHFKKRQGRGTAVPVIINSTMQGGEIRPLLTSGSEITSCSANTQECLALRNVRTSSPTWARSTFVRPNTKRHFTKHLRPAERKLQITRKKTKETIRSSLTMALDQALANTSNGSIVLSRL